MLCLTLSGGRGHGKLRAQKKKLRYFEGSRAKIPSSKTIGGPYVLKSLTLSWQSIVRLFTI